FLASPQAMRDMRKPQLTVNSEPRPAVRVDMLTWSAENATGSDQIGIAILSLDSSKPMPWVPIAEHVQVGERVWIAGLANSHYGEGLAVPGLVLAAGGDELRVAS